MTGNNIPFLEHDAEAAGDVPGFGGMTVAEVLAQVEAVLVHLSPKGHEEINRAIDRAGISSDIGLLIDTVQFTRSALTHATDEIEIN
ncbi:hypothetical protein [Leekyejoonella antrihumi]|uniref:Uncharacterized protein n=1 Tax=Leekyejoonella antrihumi TaxID=1660198 RepID=A0A563DQF8_9MICO|nr:hypothetical protein [Leekyejoonella antrihumi]TWP32455.1 hypothetical protein FGL98_24165 [Leekyejoonella antrihumi]